MKTRRPPPAAPGTDELSALIETLGATERRLLELTGGEVDSVVDAEGRTILLRHAQEQLRHGSAETQAAVLNALPAHVALLAPDGRVLSVNEAWRRYSVANGLLETLEGAEVNYLRVSDNVRGDDRVLASDAEAGIRRVLEGEAPTFTLEYACGTPEEPRWFLMTATPLAPDRRDGAIVMHLDISERKRNEEDLLRFGAAMNSVVDAIYITDRDRMQFTHVNDAACRMQGKSRPELLAIGPAALLATPSSELERIYDAVIASGGATPAVEISRPRPDGSHAWIELRRHAVCLGGRWTIVTLARDVTERRRDIQALRSGEARLLRLNRVHAVVGGINMLIVRVRDRKELFREACRIALDAGGFRMAMISLAVPEGDQAVPAASAGMSEDLLAEVTASLASADAAQTMTGRAIAGLQPVISNDLRDDETALGARYRRMSVASRAALPLVVGGVARGVLELYSTDHGFFDEVEMKLLRELADDIAFGIEHIEKTELIDYVAYYDSLTGLANRALFLERVNAWIRGAETGGHGLSVFLIDLERFKNINDSLGRRAGDALLVQVAQWLTRIAADSKLAARLGADHFAMVLPEVAAGGNLEHLVESVLGEFIDHAFKHEDAVFRLGAKVGASVYPADGVDADTLFRNAEAALKKAKAIGAPYLFHTREMTQAVAGQVTLENRLRDAVDREEFVLHYQPKVSLATGKLTGAEALIRWEDPLSGLVMPGHFIPMLEETGLIHPVGRWALRQALRDYQRCRVAGLDAVRIAVNVSPLQLRHRGFADEIAAILGTGALAGAGLELEITESLIMEDVKGSIASLEKVRALGVTIAIDDFGTGFSSLSYLARLPVDTLKIDRSFVVDMTSGPPALALVTTIISLAHSLGLKVVAEGVETEEQSRLLALHGCDEMQGYLFSKPLPAAPYEERFLVPFD